jgi:diaminopimelate decarboxylase
MDVIELAERHGTPVFVYDEQQLIDRCTEAVAAFPGGVAYASKAFLCMAMARIAHDHGMDIDVSTGGELYVALAAGVPASSLLLHGNNKSEAEIRMALESGVDRFVVDSSDEIDRIEALAPAGTTVRALLRINPGVEAHTHEYLRTGAIDSKFGVPVAEGLADAAISRMKQSGVIDLIGIHAHVGSQVFDADSFGRAIEALAPVVADADVEELSIGGGLGVPYVTGEAAPTITDWGRTVHEAARAAGVGARITAEPGRAIVASAAVTAYTLGTLKEVPGVRWYASVDGGMSDNPRPVLYGSGYEAFLARAADADRALPIRIVGKHCESGDLIVRDADLPADVRVGDVVVTPVTGAYGHSMGSNYNKVLRPPVVFVRDGSERVVVERESYSDLVAKDVG